MGESGEYKGADLIQLLNGYYIGIENSTCTYCTYINQETCSQTWNAEMLKPYMKILTSTAKRMIENAVWDTYAVKVPPGGEIDLSWADEAYLQEKVNVL